MNEIDLLKLLGQGGITLVALIVLGRIVFRIGERMVVALDRIGSKLDDHTRADTDAIHGLRQDVAVLSSRVETAIAWSDRTPVEMAGPQTPPFGVPQTPPPLRRDASAPTQVPRETSGQYSYRRPAGSGGRSRTDG